MTASERANAVCMQTLNTGDEDLAKAIEDAFRDRDECICTFIEGQNAMVNQMFCDFEDQKNVGRHDAFVSDITKAIREGKPNG